MKDITHELDNICPFCSKPHTNATPADDWEGKPTDGDLTICINCGEWSAFNKAIPGGLRKPTFEEYTHIATDPVTRRMRDAWIMVMRDKRRANRRRKT
jgi:hypothetical protein